MVKPPKKFKKLCGRLTPLNVWVQWCLLTLTVYFSPLYFSAVEDQGLVRSHTSKFHHSSELLCTAFCQQ